MVRKIAFYNPSTPSLVLFGKCKVSLNLITQSVTKQFELYEVRQYGRDRTNERDEKEREHESER